MSHKQMLFHVLFLCNPVRTYDFITQGILDDTYTLQKIIFNKLWM